MHDLFLVRVTDHETSPAPTRTDAFGKERHLLLETALVPPSSKL
jgi:hypothetical protein